MLNIYNIYCTILQHDFQKFNIMLLKFILIVKCAIIHLFLLLLTIPLYNILQEASIIFLRLYLSNCVGVHGYCLCYSLYPFVNRQYFLIKPKEKKLIIQRLISFRLSYRKNHVLWNLVESPQTSLIYFGRYSFKTLLYAPDILGAEMVWSCSDSGSRKELRKQDKQN